MAQIAAPGEASPAPGAATYPMEMRSQTAPRRGQDPLARQPAAAGSRSSGCRRPGPRPVREWGAEVGRVVSVDPAADAKAGEVGGEGRPLVGSDARGQGVVALSPPALCAKGEISAMADFHTPDNATACARQRWVLFGYWTGAFRRRPEIANEPVAGRATGEGECSEHQHGDDGCGPTRPDTPVAHRGGVDAVGTGHGWPAGGRLVGPPAAPGRPTGPSPTHQARSALGPTGLRSP